MKKSTSILRIRKVNTYIQEKPILNTRKANIYIQENPIFIAKKQRSFGK